jgi:Thiamine pyrophosphate enzyme, central domain/Thiamine pyrophosphate enzyme, C-terminal TPP binding domain
MTNKALKRDVTDGSTAARAHQVRPAMAEACTVHDVTYELLRVLDLTTVFGNPGSTEQPFLQNFPEDHPLYQGQLPMTIAGVNQVLRGHDLVVVIGAQVFRYYPYVAGEYLPQGTQLLHITSDPDLAGRAPVGESVALGHRARGENRTVLATIGDGSFQYSVQAVWTAAQCWSRHRECQYSTCPGSTSPPSPPASAAEPCTQTPPRNSPSNSPQPSPPKDPRSSRYEPNPDGPSRLRSLRADRVAPRGVQC